jgi:hypothetical protein
MTKEYRVEVKFGATWVHVDKFTRQTDALHYIKENSGEKYPMRIVRITRAIVFEEKK